MNDKFYEQKKEKQDIMINGAMEIFAKYGYKHASTDDMVKACGVSKGLWFHYFDNKLGIYSFVVGYAIKYALLELNIVIDDDVNDFYDLVLQIEKVKILLMDKYPYLPLLLISIQEENDEDALGEILEAKNQLADEIERKYSFALSEMPGDAADIKRIRVMLDATFTRLMRSYYKEPVFRNAGYLKEVSDYVAMLRRMTYGEEEPI